MSETSNFYTKVTQLVANIVTNLIFAFCAVASRLIVRGLDCIQISLCVSVNLDDLTSPSIRNPSPGLEWLEWLGYTAAVLQKKGWESVLQLGYFKPLSPYTQPATVTACITNTSTSTLDTPRTLRYPTEVQQPLLATLAVLAIVAVTTSVWTYIHLLHTVPNPALTFTILSVAVLFREYDRTWFRFKLPTEL